ncbi:MLO-like protein 1 [Telopea speciosissima]|uniref:MLO-like protein 1 n=1 Tax=Telopea speciosissima TaxID=54955 RepID=UPI001CC592A5|nr:MLO-like protein 1 [Telopea speciosissima]
MAVTELTLEHTPTWVVAVVCSVIVAISLAVERILHYTGKYLKKKNQKPLFEALQKVKEELMLLGFISLLLTVFQVRIAKICMPPSWANHMLPCEKESTDSTSGETTSHYQSSFSSFVLGSGRRLLASSTDAGYCQKKVNVWIHITILLSLHSRSI